MAIVARSPVIIDRFHENGDSFWDGDQTLWKIEVGDDTGENEALFFVVARGDGFVGGEIVCRHVERLASSVRELRALAHVPGPRRRPQISLRIEPGEIAVL